MTRAALWVLVVMLLASIILLAGCAPSEVERESLRRDARARACIATGGTWTQSDSAWSDGAESCTHPSAAAVTP